MMEKIKFMVIVKDGVDVEYVKESLESLANDLEVDTRGSLVPYGILYGNTSKSTYEGVFNAKLEYKSKIVNQMVGRPQRIEDLTETKKAEIPESLKDKIDAVHVEGTKYAC